MAKAARPGFGIWLTGLPSSGKTTLAHAMACLLHERGVSVQILDSDQLRSTLTPNPTYSPEERDWFYDVLAHLAEMLTANGVNVLIAATASRQRYRQAARDRIARFAEVLVDCPPAVCRARDPKGLWERADRGEIAGLPGANAPFEAPHEPEARVDTVRHTPEKAAAHVLERLAENDFFR